MEKIILYEIPQICLLNIRNYRCDKQFETKKKEREKGRGRRKYRITSYLNSTSYLSISTAHRTLPPTIAIYPTLPTDSLTR